MITGAQGPRDARLFARVRGPLPAQLRQYSLKLGYMLNSALLCSEVV